MKCTIPLLLLPVACAAPAAGPAAAGRAEVLDLPYQEFDQTLGQGWRAVAGPGRYGEAAGLIETWMERHPREAAANSTILHFHAGQMHAFAGAYPEALAHFRQSFQAEEPPDSPVRWNAYVGATIAFLEGDRESLVAAREVIAAGPDWNGAIPNLAVVDRLLAGLGGTYAAAYSGEPGP